MTRRRHIPRQRTLFLLDECSQLGSLTSLRQAITLLRGYGVQVWSFWQDLSQLRLLYPQDWPTMLNNSSVLQAFGLNSFQMAREWSEVVGMSINTVLRVDPQDSVLSIRQKGNRVCRRLDYLQDEMFASRYDANERYALLPFGPTER